MTDPPIRTDRLLLSPPELADAESVIRLANDPLIAEWTLSVPHPYAEADFVTWLHAAQNGWRERSAFTFAVRLPDRRLCGAVGLHFSKKYGHAEVGFWMGEPFRGKGYTSEAVKALVDYGFSQTKVIRIHAFHRRDNLGSGRVLQKAGMRKEATLESYVIKAGEAWDVVQYRILRPEWRAGKPE